MHSALPITLVSVIASVCEAAPGLYANGRHLYTACHEKVVLIGVNRMFTWCDRQGISIPEIGKSGASAVRIVALPSDSASDVDLWIQKTIDNGMIPIPELHDATGDLGRLSQMVDWWVSASVVAMLKKHEKYLIINIANESGDCTVGLGEFVAGYKTAIDRIRKAGLKVPLMIDGPCWAHDTDTLQSAAPTLQQADPEGNLIFSNHFYGKNASGVGIGFSGEAAHIKQETAEWVALGLPFVWGEFGYCDSPIDVKSLIAVANQNQVGWLAWSWGPGNTCPGLDMSSDGSFSGLHGWGLEVAVSDANSISNTAARPASILNKGVCPSSGPDQGVAGDVGTRSDGAPAADAGARSDGGPAASDAEAGGSAGSNNRGVEGGGCSAVPGAPASLQALAFVLLFGVRRRGRAANRAAR